MENDHMAKSKKAPVVFVFPYEGKPTSTRYAGFASRLQKAGALPGYDLVTVALENLAFCFGDDDSLDVFDTVSGVHLGDAAFVYLKSWEALPEEAAALALYLSYKGVPYIDTLVQGMGVSKLAMMVRLWGEGLAVPASLYVRNTEKLVQMVRSEQGKMLGEKFVAKDILGEKGKHNYLITKDELAGTIAADAGIQFICQQFIPNEGDFRIGVYVEKARFIIKRVGAGNTHLNNTSTGGRAEYIPVKDFPNDLLDTAVAATAAVGMQIAGVDLIIDAQTERPYILEVNQGSQIVTGAFVEENKAAFVEALHDAVDGRYASSHRKPLSIVGRRTTVAAPELGIAKVVTKTDSGAYTSTLHAENIHIETVGGVEELVFDIVPSAKLQTITGEMYTVRTPHFTQKAVRSSNGLLEQRFSIKTTITVKGRTFTDTITLSKRSGMRNPMLLGRQALRSRFLINVELYPDSKAIHDELRK